MNVIYVILTSKAVLPDLDNKSAVFPKQKFKNLFSCSASIEKLLTQSFTGYLFATPLADRRYLILLSKSD